MGWWSGRASERQYLVVDALARQQQSPLQVADTLLQQRVLAVQTPQLLAARRSAAAGAAEDVITGDTSAVFQRQEARRALQLAQARLGDGQTRQELLAVRAQRFNAIVSETDFAM